MNYDYPLCCQGFGNPQPIPIAKIRSTSAFTDTSGTSGPSNASTTLPGIATTKILDTFFLQVLVNDALF